ncbi:DUF3099 domain-containing protein [Pseudofrankia inefficax]|uniref:DUF3099 domain-containing protein n=1 Tax=Pseudofrankia inefficax (strain DSM 45817 / CECT 9037 / DDB 130130 / EuI1c) TaxID=298654 RepID=E3J0M5_PSEI1|nr:DUF3099 domain-containing protein [Pseudofrankia inefficax]ADP82794.1 hypothetical protein FraEuI1c_4804 [Pseudofrankia inefficax]
MRTWRRRQPVLITSAADPRHVDIRRREGQYLFWMAVRVLCFVLAVLLFHGWARFVAIAAALVIPWVAVVVANGGPAPSRRRPAGYADAAQPLGGGARPLESGRHPVVDADDPRAEPGPGQPPEPPVEDDLTGPWPPGDRPPFAPPYVPPPPRGEVGFFGPRRPPRADRRR